MKLYNCRVRLAGQVTMEVPKYAVTEKEVALLRAIHGNDAVLGFRIVGNDDKRSDLDEMQRLAAYYGATLVEKTFGMQLPNVIEIEEGEDPDFSTTLPVDDVLPDEAEEIAEIIAEPKKKAVALE
jgi:hypothetical protein